MTKDRDEMEREAAILRRAARALSAMLDDLADKRRKRIERERKRCRAGKET